MTLYMAVTADEYELPLMVTPNSQELADSFKTTRNMVLSSISHNSSGKNNGVKFVRVRIDDE